MTTSQVPLSVVMPVYNGASHIAAALRSIWNQSFQNYEFVVVDDGSTDSTAEVLSRVTDPRLRVVPSAHVGLIGARTIGIKAATGKRVAFMDSDDLCAPDRLDRQMAFLDAHPECSFVGSVYSILTPNGQYLRPRERFEWRYYEAADITLATFPFADPSAMFDRQKALDVGLYDDDYPSEKPLWYKLLQRDRAAVLGDPIYWYRWYLDSFSRPTDDTRASILEQADIEVRRRYDAANLKARRPSSGAPNDRQRTRFAAKAVDYYLLAGDYASARATAVAAWKRWPTSRRAIKLMVLAHLKRRSLRQPGVAGTRLDWFEPDEMPQGCVQLDPRLSASANGAGTKVSGPIYE